MRRATFTGLSGLLGLLASLGGTATASAQAPAEAFSQPPISREDSIAIHQAARSDQASFERFRRSRLPSTWGGGSSRCDERIGRFCLTHGAGRDDWVAPEEDPAVVQARLDLTEGLGMVADLMPGDGWIAGQRVRYLIEARLHDDAVVAARECRAERWWCASLVGFSHHYAGQAAEADSAFDVALATMDPEERQRWTDLTLILDDRAVRTYRRLSEMERQTFEDRFWRLADPLLTREGNELRSEHFARHVWDRLQQRAQSAEGISWGWDLREIVLRYGWPSGWEQTRDFSMSAGPPPLISHYSNAPQYLLPPSEALLQEGATEGEWEVEEKRRRTGYNVPLADSIARWFSPLAHQVAVFRRGDSIAVVAGYELPADSVPAGARVGAGLALLPTLDPLADVEWAIRETDALSGALVAEALAEPVILSLEIVVPEERRLARARYGFDVTAQPPGMLAVSDLLLLRGGEPLPETLEEAIDVARGSGRLLSGEEVGIYWEIYGLDAETTPQVALSLRLLEPQKGWLRRLAERAGLLREVVPIRLRWEEGVPPGQIMARSLTIRIPEVAPGMYTLELAVEAQGRESLSIHKAVEIVAR